MSLKVNLKSVYHWATRTKKSYSQTGEDVIMGFYLKDVKNGFYVDIGTNDPIYMNNTYLFYKKGWSGICVEPNSGRCKLINAVRRRDTVLNLGVGLKEAELDFYMFEPDTISTFSAVEAEEYKKLGHKQVEHRKVKVLPLSKILDLHSNGRQIDLLSTDTEGLDMEVLQSNNWEKYRPKIIVVEAVEYRKDHSTRINTKFDEFFKEKNYIKFADTYINALYMDRDYAAKAGIAL